jgi:hypothetical protein
MPYQIERSQILQSPGKRWTKNEMVSVNNWRITLVKKEDAEKICGILQPSDPYILKQHEFDRPHFNVVEGGLIDDSKSLEETIKFMGESDYYNPDGSRKTPEEIYGPEDAAWIRRGQQRP